MGNLGKIFLLWILVCFKLYGSTPDSPYIRISFNTIGVQTRALASDAHLYCPYTQSINTEAEFFTSNSIDFFINKKICVSLCSAYNTFHIDSAALVFNTKDYPDYYITNYKINLGRSQYMFYGGLAVAYEIDIYKNLKLESRLSFPLVYVKNSTPEVWLKQKNTNYQRKISYQHRISTPPVSIIPELRMVFYSYRNSSIFLGAGWNMLIIKNEFDVSDKNNLGYTYTYPLSKTNIIHNYFLQTGIAYKFMD